MNVLIIGSGGREHALAWKLAQSVQLSRLFIAPGNAGTGACGENVALDIADHAAVIRFCKDQSIGLVVVGPESPLADGLADALSDAGIRCFGPKKAAAQIEASKVFSKNFMARHGIPTARYATFTKLADAIKYLAQVNYPVVIKASGLAGGKGVILPESAAEARIALEKIMDDKAFGRAGDEVVIEERLSGEEVSLMAFTDGKTIVPMLAAQDHKRLFDGDKGPNTGGMGAYAPAPVFTGEMLEETLESVLKPVISGLRMEGNPFVGVLYAGLMLGPDGIKVLEFNCRFGDPETQAVLTLLETDLLCVLDACIDGKLAEIKIQWRAGFAVCVVLASGGYPDQMHSGEIIQFSALPENSVCFHAGTRFNVDGKPVTAGGRVLGVTAWANDLEQAVQTVYLAASKIRFRGAQYRTDIAWRAMQFYKVQINNSGDGVQMENGLPSVEITDKSAYETSGVSIDAGKRAVELMKQAVVATYTPAVLAGIGSFGGLFDAAVLKKMKKPVLVASTDGVGTKVKLAAQVGRYRSIGHDIVNHCINDILVQGARPLFFMDYFATSKLNAEQTAEVVTGIAEACKAAGVVLLGGETAEMPGVYAPGEFDVAGTIVGVLERDSILPRENEMKAGDVLIGLSSSGPHTNGFSLIRQIFANTSLDSVLPGMDVSLADSLLAPHRSYLNLLAPLLDAALPIKALVHLTGGGFIENIPRILPGNLDAIINLGTWPSPTIWSLIQGKGNISTAEMFRVFNMGIGMIIVVGAAQALRVMQELGEVSYVIGELVDGEQKVVLI